MTTGRRPRVLVLSRHYPNPAFPGLGLWVQRMVTAAKPVAEPVVVAPVPWSPPGLAVSDLARLRRVPPRLVANGVEVHHPRVLAGHSLRLHALDARLAYPFVRRLGDRLHAAQPFDLIHAHFIFPDGAVAARLGRRYGLPVATTEHAFWLPWLREHPAVARQVRRALPHLHTITVESERVREQVAAMAGTGPRVALLPGVLDDQVFVAPGPDEPWEGDQVLFVGLIRRVKGLDVLIRAMAALAAKRPRARLLVIGAGILRGYRPDERDAHALAARLGLGDRVRFAGEASPGEVAAAMRASAVVAVPSRRETFCTVAAEALASGTPVVATRCGGPEDIVTAEDGLLVPVEDAEALAGALEQVLATRERFDRTKLHARAVARFGMAAASIRLQRFYAGVLGGG